MLDGQLLGAEARKGRAFPQTSAHHRGESRLQPPFPKETEGEHSLTRPGKDMDKSSFSAPSS